MICLRSFYDFLFTKKEKNEEVKPLLRRDHRGQWTDFLVKVEPSLDKAWPTGSTFEDGRTRTPST